MNNIRIDRVIRSRRKTIALMVTADAEVVVRAPLRLSQGQIENFVAKHRSWIAKKKAEVGQRPARKERRCDNGEEFLFLGQKFRLCFEPNPCITCIDIRDALYVPVSMQPEVANAIRECYRIQAEEKIVARCRLYAGAYGYTPSRIRVSDAKRRWGSCSTKASVSFSWRLICAPWSVIDYVIVHELVHIEEHNHSSRFWRRVEEILPDYKERKAWLAHH
jgi:predicted metal-dependent hydrolase